MWTTPIKQPKGGGKHEKVYRLCSGLAIFSYGLLLFLGIHPLLARVGSFFPMKKCFAKTNVWLKPRCSVTRPHNVIPAASGFSENRVGLTLSIPLLPNWFVQRPHAKCASHSSAWPDFTKTLRVVCDMQHTHQTHPHKKHVENAGSAFRATPHNRRIQEKVKSRS